MDQFAAPANIREISAIRGPLFRVFGVFRESLPLAHNKSLLITCRQPEAFRFPVFRRS